MCFLVTLRMKVCVILLCLCFLGKRTEAQSKSYLITAPVSLRLDASESVLLQLFGYGSEEVTVYVFLKTSMAPDHTVLAQEVVTLNTQNHHQAIAKVRLYPNQLDKKVRSVVLHVQTAGINQHVVVPLSRSNGFLFIQTDKPLYTPHQSVKVRAFSLNQELRPANRSVFLKFKNPDSETVDIVEIIDVNNGVPSMQNPFKIPINPKLGIWSIEASYADDFTTTAKTDFEVKEYVLPSFSILVEPEVNYISYGQFKRFTFKVSARYLHGAPVADAEVFLRYGYVSGKNPPVIIPTSVTRERLSSLGEVDVTVNMENILSKHDGPKDLNSLMGKYLYIAVLLQEDTGGISQEAEFAAVKFVKSPYTLSLVSTPPFIKPGLPYNIQVLVKDHLDKPVNLVQVRLVDRQLFRQGRPSEDMSCTLSSSSQSSGIAVFICNTPQEAVKAVLKFETVDPALPATSQASLTLQAVAYYSPNQRYLYIDPPLLGHSLVVGQYANIKVYSATPSYLSIKSLGYMVLSKGTVVKFGTQKFVSSADNKQNLRFEVTASMVPSIRLLIYYILYGEGTSELVADSLWMDVKDKCVNGLQTDLSSRRQNYKPKENIQLDIRANQGGLVALSAVDSALFSLRPNYRDPISMVLRHIEHSDQGCGGGGGKDSADVFRLAGLTFITNANAEPSSTSSDACTAAVRAKRAMPTDEEKMKKVQSYGQFKTCCEHGMKYIPKSVTCHQFALQTYSKHPRCRNVFRECCEYMQQQLDQDQNLVLGRHEMGADFDLAPSLVRSYFPESWLWEVQPVRPGSESVSRTLPDSLTTWEVKAIGMFKDGICVAQPVQVSVSLPLSVNVPLPYQVVRGEQLELRGSVYNQQADTITYCVTLTAGPELCLLHSQETSGAVGLRSTPCSWSKLPAGGVGSVSFTLLGLEPGEHTLTFTLKTRQGNRDILEKKLRVVPEGVMTEEYSGGRLDPQGIYGSEKIIVTLKNKLSTNIIPNSPVERLLTINGEVLGDFLSVVHKPEGLRQLVNLPAGSAEAELGGLLTLIHVYRYLETAGKWEVLGADIHSNSAALKQMIREGLVSITSFRHGDSSYSMWIKQKPSTWLTALVVKMLSLVDLDQIISVDHQTLSYSVAWLIRSAQQGDGSFSDTSSYRPNKIMAAGTDAVDKSVYLTSFVLIALCRATSIRDPILNLQFHDDSMRSASKYISQHALGVKSVYVRAVATYALTLHDPNSMMVSQLLTNLENVARQKGHPAVLRYWQESNVATDWLNPDQSSGVTVETTAYMLLTTLLKGRIPYANPILSWLSQDQHYGEGFYSVQDTVLTLEALTEYSRLVPRAVLSQDINIRYRRKGSLQQVKLSQSLPVITPIQVTKNDDIIVSTGYGKGVSNVKLKTVYYETRSSTQNCNFDTTIEMLGPDNSRNPSMRAPYLVTCAKYKPPPNEVYTESSLTVIKIQMPTGVEASLEDLKQFKEGEDPIVSHYELQGSTVVVQMDTVPSDIYVCIGFRVKTRFRVSGASESLLSIYEPQDKGSICTKHFSFEEQKLQRLCVGEECQCMRAACAAYRGEVDPTLTVTKRIEETCRPHIRYAYRMKVTSSAAEGDFMIYTGSVVEVLKNNDKEFEAVSSGAEVELIKKATCTTVDIKNDHQYLVMGVSGSEVTLSHGFRYRLPLDSEAVVELWKKDCGTSVCSDYSLLEDFALELQLSSCPNSS
ncbi:complement C5 [Solea senegalensis]|uniref:Complement C5 n=1 Tax=Solea senegalensis TaxID=28829 RepID=A0AAV6QFS3_SOLSE|nr:complement C5 [Solea senegalensis]KAG7490391.1 complement C5 [Solea senegalensis]